MIKRLLIANRGEIACRIIRTAKKMGIHTIAVYSKADARAMHKEMADESVCIGEAASQYSYLNGKAIIDAATAYHAEAIHPGYGFLSENAAFAHEIKQAGLLFIGAPVDAIAAMGDKSSAKTMMETAGIPVIPGFSKTDASTEALTKAATEITYPLLLKASAGGGGKGMRVVHDPADFTEALEQAQREAKSAFGNDHIILEKYLDKPRHVEVQIFFDQQGKGVYLFDRDCSLQRRYQKVIEEAPAPGLSKALHQALGETAVRAGKAVNYVGAGTIEFLLDSDHQFYFMEMNTRLQVEHPVTEMITGVDLVKWQIEIACDKPLPVSQTELTIKGHAVESRLYAEEPKKNFIPATGKIDYLKWPDPETCLRVETGIRAQDEITSWYDPMIAKLVTWGKDRNQAVQNMEKALKATRIAGLPTNRDFLIQLVKQPDFQTGNINTSLIYDHIDAFFPPAKTLTTALIVVSLYVYYQTDTFMKGWRMNLPETGQYIWQTEEKKHHVTLVHLACQWQIQVDGKNYYFDDWKVNKGTVTLFPAEQKAETFHVIETVDTYTFFSEVATLTLKRPVYAATEQQKGSCTAPMNGVVSSIKIDAGTTVNKGETVLTMEAMKMELGIKAPRSGIVNELFFAAGDMVQEGTTLFSYKEKA